MSPESTKKGRPKGTPTLGRWSLFAVTVLVGASYVGCQSLVSSPIGGHSTGLVSGGEVLRLWLPLAALVLTLVWLVGVKFLRGVDLALSKYAEEFSSLLGMFLTTQCCLLVAASSGTARWWNEIPIWLALVATGGLWTNLIVNWRKFYLRHTASVDALFRRGPGNSESGLPSDPSESIDSSPNSSDSTSAVSPWTLSRLSRYWGMVLRPEPQPRLLIALGTVASVLSLGVIVPRLYHLRSFGPHVFDFMTVTLMVLAPTLLLWFAAWSLRPSPKKATAGDVGATTRLEPGGVGREASAEFAVAQTTSVQLKAFLAPVLTRWLRVWNRPPQLDVASYALLSVAALAIASTALLFGAIEVFHTTRLASWMHLGTPFVAVPGADVASRLSAWFALGVEQFFLSNEVFFDFFQSVGADSRLIEAAGGRSLEVTSGSAVSLIVFGGHLVFGATVAAVVTDQIALYRRVTRLFGDLELPRNAVAPIGSILREAPSPCLPSPTLELLHDRGLLEGEVSRILRRTKQSNPGTLPGGPKKRALQSTLTLGLIPDEELPDANTNAWVAAVYCSARWYPHLLGEKSPVSPRNSSTQTGSPEVDSSCVELDQAAGFGAQLLGSQKRDPSDSHEFLHKRLKAELGEAYARIYGRANNRASRDTWAQLAWAWALAERAPESHLDWHIDELCQDLAGLTLDAKERLARDAKERLARTLDLSELGGSFWLALLEVARLLRGALSFLPIPYRVVAPNPYHVVAGLVAIRGLLLEESTLSNLQRRDWQADLYRLVEIAVADPKSCAAAGHLHTTLFVDTGEEETAESRDSPASKHTSLTKVLFRSFEASLADLPSLCPALPMVAPNASASSAAASVLGARETRRAAADANVSRVALLELVFFKREEVDRGARQSGGAWVCATDSQVVALVAEALHHLGDVTANGGSKAAVARCVMRHLSVVLEAVVGITREVENASPPSPSEQLRGAIALLDELPKLVAQHTGLGSAHSVVVQAVHGSALEAITSALRRVALLICVDPAEAATEEPVGSYDAKTPLSFVRGLTAGLPGALLDQPKWRWIQADDPRGGFCVLDFPVTDALWAAWPPVAGHARLRPPAPEVADGPRNNGDGPDFRRSTTPRLDESFRAITAFIERLRTAFADDLSTDWTLRVPTFDEWRVYSVLQTDSRTYSMPVRRTECAVNRFGIFAPRGHVLEWVLSDSGDAPTPLVVGASWVMAAERSRTDAKTSADPGFHRADIGFRLVLTRRRPAD